MRPSYDAVIIGAGSAGCAVAGRPSSADPTASSEIDLGLFNDDADRETLVAGFKRPRALLAEAPFGDRRALGEGDRSMTPELRVRGVDGLRVADASVLPAVTSANTNAPAMMIGHRAGGFVAAALGGNASSMEAAA